MSNKKELVGPEEAAALLKQFSEDWEMAPAWNERGPGSNPGQVNMRAIDHALRLAIQRERERALSHIAEHLKRYEALTHQMGERYDQRCQIAIETLEAVEKKVRGEE